ncbi:hypothetical protein [Blautia sp.]|uniref:hypothetical protein n=1 Tax=Blautia sp. TaxID=1955243 RepID=UPI003990AB69
MCFPRKTTVPVHKVIRTKKSHCCKCATENIHSAERIQLLYMEGAEGFQSGFRHHTEKENSRKVDDLQIMVGGPVNKVCDLSQRRTAVAKA